MSSGKHMPEAGGREIDSPDAPEGDRMLEKLVALGVLVSMVASLSPGLFELVLSSLRPPAVQAPR